MAAHSYHCSICHEGFRTPEFAARCQAQGIPALPYQLGDVLVTSKEAGRILTIVELRVHHGTGKCPVDGPCEHAVTYQASLLHPMGLTTKTRAWVACLGRLKWGYIPTDAKRIATLTMPGGTQWGVIPERGDPATYLVTPSEEEWRRLWEAFPREATATAAVLFWLKEFEHQILVLGQKADDYRATIKAEEGRREAYKTRKAPAGLPAVPLYLNAKAAE